MVILLSMKKLFIEGTGRNIEFIEQEAQGLIAVQKLCMDQELELKVSAHKSNMCRSNRIVAIKRHAQGSHHWTYTNSESNGLT